MQVTIENAFDSQSFQEWFDAVHEAIGPDHCWDSGPMFEALVGLYNAEENPKDAAEQALKDFEEWQFNLEMAVPSWDR